jgi:hypothetical protein
VLHGARTIKHQTYDKSLGSQQRLGSRDAAAPVFFVFIVHVHGSARTECSPVCSSSSHLFLVVAVPFWQHVLSLGLDLSTLSPLLHYIIIISRYRRRWQCHRI